MTKDKSNIGNRKSKIPLIVAVNDDGIKSPGLRAAVRTMMDIGEVLVVAPRDQQTAVGRAFIGGGIAQPIRSVADGKRVRAFAIATSPALAVRYAVLILADRKPALVVSGINYGENIGNSVTVSGTVGAAWEAASMGIPALAVSLVLDARYHYSYDDAIDFSAAAYFAQRFARRILLRGMPRRADIVNVNVPQNARKTTPWRWTRLARANYYRSLTKETLRGKYLDGYELALDIASPERDSDVRAAMMDHVVSVTPLTLDLTARVTAKEKARWGKVKAS
jgi:5'-nucleotidase